MLTNVFSWRSGCIDSGSAFIAMGWGGEPSRLSSQWIRFKPFRCACHNGYIWFRLCWSFSVPKYLHIHEKTITISSSFNNQVSILASIISRTSLHYYFPGFKNVTKYLRSCASALLMYVSDVLQCCLLLLHVYWGSNMWLSNVWRLDQFSVHSKHARRICCFQNCSLDNSMI